MCNWAILWTLIASIIVCISIARRPFLRVSLSSYTRMKSFACLPSHAVTCSATADAPPARFYESEHGNDALAAGMFDISVVRQELSHPPMHTAGSSASIDTAGNTEGAREPSAAHPILPRAVELLRTDDSYRPRTSSKALEPCVALLTGGDDSYRPRTSSRALEPQFTPPDAHPQQEQADGGESTLAQNVAADDGSYRPRTSSKAIEPETLDTRD
eukprot:m.985903 g.985903  ORF g.985903 m.985903 type:complete len:215 (-) comp23987_c0_seq8:202-846(-)